MNSIKDSNIDSNRNSDRGSQLTPDTRLRIVNEIPESDLDKSASTSEVKTDNEKLALKMLELKKLLDGPEIDPELDTNLQNLTDMDPGSSTNPSQSLPMPLIKTAGVSGEMQVQNNQLNPLQQQQQSLLSPNNNINNENNDKNKQKEKQELASSRGIQSQFYTSPFQSISMPVINQNYNSNLTGLNGPLLTGGMQSQSRTYPLLTPENLKSTAGVSGGPQVQNNLLNPLQQQTPTQFLSGITAGVSVGPQVQNNLHNQLQQKTPTQLLSGVTAGVSGVPQVQNNPLNALHQQTSQMSSGLTGGISGLTQAQQNILNQFRQRQDEHNLVQQRQIHMLFSGTTGGSVTTQAQYDPLNLFQQQQKNEMPFGMTGGGMEAQNNQLNLFQQKKENQPFGMTVGGMEALNNQLNLLQLEQQNSLRIQTQLNEMLDAEYKLMNMQKKCNLMSQQMQHHKQNGAQTTTTTTMPIIGTQPGVFVPTPEEGSSGGKLVSISAMPSYKDMSPDELRWAHYNNNKVPPPQQQQLSNVVLPPQQQQISNVVLPPQQQQISNVVETNKGAAPPQHQPQLSAQQQEGNGKFKGLKEQEPTKNDIKFEVQCLESKMKEMERKQKYLFGGLFFMLVVIAVMVGIRVLGVDFFLGL